MDLSDVRVVFGPEELRRIGEFRYRIYIEEQGKSAVHADHAARTLVEPADHRAASTVFWIEREGQIVGTVRAEILTPQHEDSEYLKLDALDFIEPTKIIYFSRMMVAREARRSDVTPKLCFLGFQKGLLKDCWLGVLTCKPALVPLFQTYGYTPYADEFTHPESGRQVPMAIVGEVEYLSSRAAPLTLWLSAYRAHSPFTARFLERIAKYHAESSSEPRERQACALTA